MSGINLKCDETCMSKLSSDKCRFNNVVFSKESFLISLANPSVFTSNCFINVFTMGNEREEKKPF